MAIFISERRSEIKYQSNYSGNRMHPQWIFPHSSGRIIGLIGAIFGEFEEKERET